MDVLNVSSKGQLVIPERVRKKFGIHAGTRLVLLEKGDTIVLKKENEVERKYLQEEELKEKLGWMMIAEGSLKKDWNNSKEDEHWGRYL